MNKIELKGRIDKMPFYSFNCGYDRYYKVYINVVRNSGYEDVIPCYIHEYLKDRFIKDGFVHITGELKSRKCKNGRKLIFVMIKTAKQLDNEEYYNFVKFEEECFAVKVPEVHKTAYNTIASLMIASNGHINVGNNHNESAYIPVIVWDKKAKEVAKTIKIGSRVVGEGVFHSRTYNKFCNDGNVEEKTFYEISMENISIVEG